jgi:hypothetical protein
VRLAWVVCAIIAIVAIVASRDARADGAGVIAVSEGDRAGVAAALVEAMAGRAGRLVPDAVAEARGALAAGAVPVEQLAGFRRVRAQIDDGWQHYLRAAFDTAASMLANARTEAEPLVALPGGAELYAEAALKLGAVLDRQPERKDESQAVIALALALDPDRPITLAEFSPEVKRTIEAVQALVPPEATLRVAVKPADALVQVDRARARGAGEITVPRGQHLVVVRAPGYRTAVRGVAADATSVELELERDGDGTRLAAGATRDLAEPAAQELVDATLRYADLDEVVLAAETVRRGGPTLLVQRCAGLPARCSAVVDVGFSDRRGLAAAARTAWAAARTGELRYPPTVLGLRADNTTHSGRCGKTCKRIVWAGVGAAVVAGVITLVVTSSTAPPPVVTVDGTSF